MGRHSDERKHRKRSRSRETHRSKDRSRERADADFSDRVHDRRDDHENNRTRRATNRGDSEDRHRAHERDNNRRRLPDRDNNNDDRRRQAPLARVERPIVREWDRDKVQQSDSNNRGRRDFSSPPPQPLASTSHSSRFGPEREERRTMPTTSCDEDPARKRQLLDRPVPNGGGTDKTKEKGAEMEPIDRKPDIRPGARNFDPFSGEERAPLTLQTNQNGGDGAETGTAQSNEKVSKPSFEPSGKLAADTNTFKGVVIKYNEPPEAAKPKLRWRLYPMKDDDVQEPIYIHRQSAYLVGRDHKISDFPVSHPSCSKQHAVLQYRSIKFERSGISGRRTLPYIIDLASANGTYLNGERIEAQRYYELKEQDIIRFGFSSREYVVLHELSSEGKGGEALDEVMEDDAEFDNTGIAERVAKEEAEDYF